MDGGQFDRFARIFATPAPRRDFGRLSAAVFGMVGFYATAMPGAAKNKRKKVTLCHQGQTITVRKRARNAHLSHGDMLGACPSPPPPPPVAPSCTDTFGITHQPGYRCHGSCCSLDQQCCSPRVAGGGNERVPCFPLDYYCCPASSLAGACPPDLFCCPRPKHGPPDGHCGGPGAAIHCCPQDSGGACANDRACCPPAMTNGSNFGCCPIGQNCCAESSDCDEVANETCTKGCCTAPLPD